VTRKAVSAAERLRAVAATSMTFAPGSSGTSERKRPATTCALRPWTWTRAVLGLTVPVTCTVRPRTSAVSEGLETWSFTGGFGFCAVRSSPPHPASAATRAARRSVRNRTTVPPG
jgi:hypothetical protein